MASESGNDTTAVSADDSIDSTENLLGMDDGDSVELVPDPEDLPSPTEDDYLLFLCRIAIIHIRGKPSNYNQNNILMAVKNAGFLQPGWVQYVSSLENGRKWQLRFRTPELRDDFLEKCPYLEVALTLTTVECHTTTFCDDVYNIKAKNIPAYTPPSTVLAHLAQFGEYVRHREESDMALGVKFLNGNLIATMKTKNAEDIPDTMHIVVGQGDKRLEADVNLVVLGLPPRCYKCKERGHVSKNCHAVICEVTWCRSTHHSTAMHEQAMKDKTASNPTPAETRDLETQRALERKAAVAKAAEIRRKAQVQKTAQEELKRHREAILAAKANQAESISLRPQTSLGASQSQDVIPPGQTSPSSSMQPPASPSLTQKLINAGIDFNQSQLKRDRPEDDELGPSSKKVSATEKKPPDG